MKHPPSKPRVLSVALAAMLGSIAPPAEQELRLAIAARGGRVTIGFPRVVQNVNLSPDQAEAMGQALIKHAAEARAQQSSPEPGNDVPSQEPEIQRSTNQGEKA